MSGQKPSEPRRNRKRDRSEIQISFLPVGNPRAKTAYLCALYGLIPGLGMLLGPAAIIYGRLGYRAAKRELDGKGIGHCFVSIVLGCLETLSNAVGLPFLAHGLGWI